MKRALLLTSLMAFGCKETPKPAPPPPPAKATSQPAKDPASQPVQGAASQPAGDPASQPSTLPAKMEGSQTHEEKSAPSTVAYKDKRCSGATPCECTGTIMYGQNALAQIGISEADLTKGTLCLIADLDGNGTSDLIFVDKNYGKGPAAATRILLFDEVGLRDTPALPKKVSTLAVHKQEDQTGLLEAATRTFFVYANGKFEMKKI